MDTGIALVARASYAVGLGQESAWYLLARRVMGLTQAAAERAAATAEVEESGPAPEADLVGRSRATGLRDILKGRKGGR